MKFVGILFAASLVSTAAFADGRAKFVSLEDRLMEEAARISIPRVELKETTLADALEFLRREARANDHKHEGVAIEADLKPQLMIEFLPGSKNQKPIPPGGWPLYKPLEQRITLSLRDISLVEALRYVAGLANCKVVASRRALAIVSPESVWNE